MYLYLKILITTTSMKNACKRDLNRIDLVFHYGRVVVLYQNKGNIPKPQYFREYFKNLKYSH